MWISFLAAAGILVINSINDLKKREILLIPTLLAAVTGAVFQVIFSGNNTEIILESLIPGGCAVLFSIASRGKIGMGDALVILCIGIWRGADETFLMSITGMLMAAATGICMHAAGKTGKEIPLVPFFLTAEMVMGILNI